MTVTAEQMAYVGFFFQPNPQLIAVDGFLPADLTFPPTKGGNELDVKGRGNLALVSGVNAITFIRGGNVALVTGAANTVEHSDANGLGDC